jgi:hypothetical protein
MPALIAFYDANVLYPAELRNFLMHLALTGAIRAKRSAAASAFKAMPLKFIRSGHFQHSPIHWTI